jgi:SPOR domain
MTQFHVLARHMALAATVACVFAGGVSAFSSSGEARTAKSGAQPAGPSAQGPQSGNDAGKKVAQQEAAKKAYDTGLKAYAAGKYQSAIEALSTAVKSGMLSSPEMAKALLTRGLAYKKDNKPGQSISDLTGAIWLKNGLSASEQKSAIAERSEAYRMAGLPDTGSTPDQRAIGTPAAPSASSNASAANVAVNSAPGPNAGSAGLSAAAIAEAAGAQKSASVSTGSDGTSATVTRPLGSETAPVTGGETTPASSGGIAGFFGWSQPSQAPAQPAPASSGSSFTKTVTAIPGNVSGFFSNMFGGGSSAPAPEPSPSPSVMTASTNASAPETSSWSSATSIAAGGQRENLRAEKASYAPEPHPTASVARKGKYKIHIAALRSKAQAEALAQKLIAEHGRELGNHVPVVDAAVIGSMGTFYRVRIAGYASQEEPRGLCNKLRSSGLDCLVVTN